MVNVAVKGRARDAAFGAHSRGEVASDAQSRVPRALPSLPALRCRPAHAVGAPLLLFRDTIATPGRTPSVRYNCHAMRNLIAVCDRNSRMHLLVTLAGLLLRLWMGGVYRLIERPNFCSPHTWAPAAQRLAIHVIAAVVCKEAYLGRRALTPDGSESDPARCPCSGMLLLLLSATTRLSGGGHGRHNRIRMLHNPPLDYFNSIYNDCAREGPASFVLFPLVSCQGPGRLTSEGPGYCDYV